MNLAHVHLLLNHIPVLGTLFGLLLLAYGMLKKSEEIKRVSLGIFVIVAVMTIPVMLSGEPAKEIVQHLPGVSEPIIEAHKEAAFPALTAIVILGIVALIALWRSRNTERISQRFVIVVLILSIVVCGLMAWTANLGGKIRHTEIRSEANAALPIPETKVNPVEPRSSSDFKCCLHKVSLKLNRQNRQLPT